MFFRADASAEIGYGHFIRTLALADMLKDLFDCTFFVVNPSGYQTQEIQKICSYRSLISADPLAGFLEFLEGEEIVVLDNYFYTTEYQRNIKEKGCVLVCIDDMHDKHYLADIVINHGLSDPSLFDVETYTRLCLGYEWALLRRPFFKIKNTQPECKSSLLHVVVCLGGSDQFNITGRFIDYLKKQPCIGKITAVVGDKYDRNYCIESDRLVYAWNLSAEAMAFLFKNADLAFLSSSTVCLEALACGVTVAAGYYVDNQMEMYDGFVSRNLVYPLNNLLRTLLDTVSFSEILDFKINKKNIDISLSVLNYQHLFNSLFNRTDHRYEGLSYLDYTHLNPTQVKEVWGARNNQTIRCQMENQEIIPWTSHLSFIQKLFQSYEKRYWAVYKDSSIIGSINIEYLNPLQVERGIFILPEYWGTGLSQKIESAITEIVKESGCDSIVAKVKRENMRSLVYHQKMGYDQVSQDDKYLHMIKFLYNE